MCNVFQNIGKVIYDSIRKIKQQFAHRKMRFYLDNFEQNILFGPFQLYELSSYCEIFKNWKSVLLNKLFKF